MMFAAGGTDDDSSLRTRASAWQMVEMRAMMVGDNSWGKGGLQLMKQMNTIINVKDMMRMVDDDDGWYWSRWWWHRGRWWKIRMNVADGAGEDWWMMIEERAGEAWWMMIEERRWWSWRQWAWVVADDEGESLGRRSWWRPWIWRKMSIIKMICDWWNSWRWWICKLMMALVVDEAGCGWRSRWRQW